MSNSAKQINRRSTLGSALRVALGMSSLVLLAACGGGSGGGGAATSAPVELGAALPEQGDFIAIAQRSLSLSEASRTGTVQVSRLGSAAGSSSVNYSFVAGSASAATDYRGENGVLNWADGDSSDKTISFIVSSDADDEGDENFRIEISGVDGQESLGINDSVTVTLQDSACSTAFPSTIESDTTLSGPCYRLSQNARVLSSAQLTINAGTTIIADDATSLTFNGQSTLNMAGTSALPVFVKSTSKQAGSWDGFKLNSTSALHRVQHSEISGAKNAFDLSSGGFAAFANNTMTDNTGAGVKLPISSADSLSDNNTFVSTARGIELVGNTIDANETIRLPAQSTHYVVGSGLLNNGTLELAAGTDLRMAADVQILIFATGSISAVGTADQPITIEGLQAIPGYWNGIQYISSTSDKNRFEHVTISHGGGDPARAGNIIVDGLNTRITMQHCAVTHSAGYGVVYDSRAFQVDLNDVTFDQNSLGDQSL